MLRGEASGNISPKHKVGKSIPLNWGQGGVEWGGCGHMAGAPSASLHVPTYNPAAGRRVGSSCKAHTRQGVILM